MPRVAGSVVPAVCPVYACRSQMEFRILGPLEVCSEGREISLGGAKQRAVLAVLLLHRNEVVSTDRLIDELWSDRPPATAAKVVQVYVSQLRKALRGRHARDEADSILVTRAPGYVLRVEPGSSMPTASSSSSTRAGARSRQGVLGWRPIRCWRAWRCGAGPRLPTSPTNRSRKTRSRDSRKPACRRSRNGSTPTLRSVAKPSSSVSSSRSSPPIRYERGFVDS